VGAAVDPHLERLAGNEQDVVVEGPVLPPTLEQLAGDQQGGLDPVVLEHQLTDHRASLPLVDLHPSR
jgi:hypothetical protein